MGERYLGFLSLESRPFANKQEVLQYHIEVKSPRPAQIPPRIWGFATDLEAWGFTSTGETLYERIEELMQWLSGHLLTFAIDAKLSGGQTHHFATNVNAYPCAEGDLWEYEAVPVLRWDMLGSPSELLTQGRPLRGFKPPERSPGSPLVVVVASQFYGPFARILPSSGGYGLRAEPGEVGRVPAVADGLAIIEDDACWFVSRDRFKDLVAELRAAAGALLAEPGAAAGLLATQDDPDSAPLPIRPPALQPREAPRLLVTLRESDFLQRLHDASAAQGLYFRDADLLHFHTALKTGSLVVLEGLSGTGKSRLVEVYRRALGLEEGDNFLWLSVRPNWDDDADLIGYYDPLNRLYRPGETGLVDLLRRAEQRPYEMFLVCFDEMNLARVEHYFAQFLSNLERPEDERYLRLYTPELQSAVLNAYRYPPAIRIHGNVLFCGTVNVDESTHAFSDKVLDRANLLRMDHVDIQTWWEQVCASGAAPAGAARVMPPVSVTAWQAWCPPFDPRPYQAQVTFLQQLGSLLGQAGRSRPFGYRVVQQILLYLQRVPRDASGGLLIALDDALDLQVAQRILTKVRGASEDLLDLFAPTGELQQLLDQSPLGPFARSKAEVSRKYRELERHEFTS